MFVRLHEDFSSAYKIGKYIKSCETYVAPVTVKLPPCEDGQVPTFQYIPVIELIKMISSQPGFRSPPGPPSTGEVLQDVKDGACMENNQYFQVRKFCKQKF